ncbi:uncharacterized protein LOC129958849 [Argiope bruennichi]|uniref:protein-serine/threonine phosphatase n=1 Tax=Argiope bruennichi TaxID=94029 RepID=A0A8T0F5P4_ARGBR|nr:uncharacterized protein LOC129958849 [Argiope bruennichi]KAF8785732.1 putative protein phosphatase 2C 70 like protein [Argiope bruennichi]
MARILHRFLPAAETDIEIETGSADELSYTAASMQGWRKNQEDRYICLPNFYENSCYFGVFDGHGGFVVAEFLKRRLHVEIKYFLRDGQDTETALHSGFLTCDSSMRTPETIDELNSIIEEHFGSSSDDDDDEDSSSSDSDEEIRQPAFACGSTATVAIIENNTIYVANVGDSRCVLSRDRIAIDLSKDHRPDDLEERIRITNAGGTVSQDGRINGSLNLSRGFGDFRFKSTCDTTQQMLSVEPFIKSIAIEENDEFLIIASDGIWNSMGSQDVVDFVTERFQDEECDLEEICKNIFHLNLSPNPIKEGTGCDNMTAIIVMLNNAENL